MCLKFGVCFHVFLNVARLLKEKNKTKTKQQQNPHKQQKYNSVRDSVNLFQEYWAKVLNK